MILQGIQIKQYILAHLVQNTKSEILILLLSVIHIFITMVKKLDIAGLDMIFL